MQTELDNLPDYNSFGDSNAEDKFELQTLIAALKRVRNEGVTNNQEVIAWLHGRFSALSDYES